MLILGRVLPTPKKNLYKKIVPDAQDLGKSYGIRPSFIIAQAALDSDFGEKILANKYHNLFGLLAEPGTPSITLNDSSTGKKNRKSNLLIINLGSIQCMITLLI